MAELPDTYKARSVKLRVRGQPHLSATVVRGRRGRLRASGEKAGTEFVPQEEWKVVEEGRR